MKYRIGAKHFRWTLLERIPPIAPSRWRCRCECGTERIVHASNISSGTHQSCGCKRNENNVARATHHATKNGRPPPEYRAWKNLWQRCTNPRTPGWKNYGGRGIAVCDRWKSYEAFLSDMGPRPSPKHSIDRADNEAGYSPANCRWTTRAIQARNRRNVVLNDALVQRIREMHQAGQRICDISRELKLHESTVGGVAAGRKWANNFEVVT